MLGSSLLDALATPLSKWKPGTILQATTVPQTNTKSPVQFVDVAREAGLNSPNVWGDPDHKRYIIEAKGSGLAFFDYDNDGWLDIYLTNGTRLDAHWPAGQAPTSHLYKNNRDGTFTDVTEKSGLACTGWQTGVCVGDYDNDGFDDLFCCFWGHNILFHNNSDGTFSDLAVLAGVAYSDNGHEQAGMGVAVADYDCDGSLDIFKTNFADDTCNLYRNNGDGTFTDVTFSSGIGINNGYVAWGCAFLDYDNDGWADLMQINGHVYPEIEGHAVGQTYKNPRLVYRNMGNGHFTDVSAQMGPGITEKYSSRGAAFGDYDNDGDIDALVLNLGDLPSLLRNDGGTAQNWIKLKLIGTVCNRTAIGARVRVVTGTHFQIDEVHSGSSVMSQSDLRLHFGVGKSQIIDLIEVKWPTTQKIERFTKVPANQILTIREAHGITSTFKPKSK